MTPQIAISLSHDGISVLSRGRGGWDLVGSVELDHPRLDRRLRKLRDTAREAAGGSAASLLIIPNSEILYTHVTAPGPDDAARAAQIRQGLDGLTPYPVDELVFTWHAEGDLAAVSVVARETLDEAEAFAATHELGAVGFAAFPEDPGFGKEVYLAPTRAAPAAPPASPAPAPGAGRGGAGPDVSGGVAQSEAQSEAQPQARAEAQSQARAEAPESPTPDASAVPAKQAPAPKPGADTGGKSVARTAPERDPAPAFASRRAPASTSAPKVPEPATAGAAAPAPVAPAPAAAPAEKSAKEAFSVQSLKDGVKGVTSKLLGGRRSGDPAAQVRSSDRLGRRAREILSKTGQTPDAAAPHPAPGAATAATLRARIGAVAARGKSVPTAPKPAAPSDPDALKKALAAPVQNHASRAPAARAPAAGASSEAEKLTIFGARGNTTASEGFGRRGLLLTGGLLLVLAAVAVWALYFTADQPAPPADVALVDPVVEAPADAVAPGAETAPEAAPLTEPDPVPADTDTAALPQPDELLPLDEQAAIDDTLAAIDSDVAVPLEPATDTPAAPPPLGADDSGDVRAETAAPTESGADPVVLSELTPPSAVASDLPTLPASPAPFGTETLPGVASAGPGAEPTPEVIEGTPPSAPPVRPEGLGGQEDAALEPDAPGAADGDTAIAETDATPGADAAAAGDVAPFSIADARFAAARPEPRSATAAPQTSTDAQPVDAQPVDAQPADAQPADAAAVDADAMAAAISPGAIDPAASAAEGGDDTAAADASRAAPAGGIALAALQPDLRPEARPEARPELVPAVAATAPITPADIPGLDSAEPMAVASSLQPGARPAGFADRVAEIRAAMRAAAPAQPTAASAPMPSATPTIPSSASVARAATQARAIDTRQINLLGVSGPSSNRTALVRLPNGSVERVRVGDQLDRGQVTAIGEDELVYVRRSRTIRLRIGES